MTSCPICTVDVDFFVLWFTLLQTAGADFDLWKEKGLFS